MSHQVIWARRASWKTFTIFLRPRLCGTTRRSSSSSLTELSRKS